MKRLLLLTPALFALPATAQAKPARPKLSLADKRAACAVAFREVFFRVRPGGNPARIQQDRKEHGRTFLEAYDEGGREVTPAAIVTFLRHQGANVHPAWTEKRFHPANEPRRFGGFQLITLRNLKYFSDGRIRWEIWENLVAPSSSGLDGSAQQSFVELRKVGGRWKVMSWASGMSAG